MLCCVSTDCSRRRESLLDTSKHGASSHRHFSFRLPCRPNNHVLEANPIAQPHLRSGAALYEQGKLAEASQAFGSALASQPDLSPARFNLGVICRDLEENEAAESHFRELIAAGEILPESYNNLGILASRRESGDEAMENYRQAIRLRHQFPLAHFNLATLLLRLGHWQEGWNEYEWRWQTPTFTPIQCPQPKWDGGIFDGTLLLHTEQGIGDVFQFARFIPMIRERCRRVMFVRPETLEGMFSGESWGDEVRSPGTFSLDTFDAFLPLMSAPRVLNIAVQDLQCGENYLTPAARHVDLGASPVADAKLKVGITWCGSPTHSNDAFRSMPVESFRPLFDIPDVAYYSLQIADAANDLDRLGSQRCVVRDLSGVQRDFADTAAIVRQLDLVITVDTSLLHLSGGLGLPAWGLISRRSDWRWLGHDRSDTPWYPSVRLFRQRRLGDWDELMQRVATELRVLLSRTSDSDDAPQN